MATVTNLATGATGSTNSATTGAITPSGNRLIIVGVISARASGSDITTPTITGGGITFVQINTRVANSSNWRLTLFRGLVAAPSSGVLVIDFAGQTQDQGVGWSIVEVSPVKITGTNGADAVVQSATGLAISANIGLVVNLSAFTSSSNIAFGMVATQGVSITPGAGFTQIGASSITAAFFQSQYGLSGDSSVDWTWGATGTEGPGIAIEIALDTGGILPGEI